MKIASEELAQKTHWKSVMWEKPIIAYNLLAVFASSAACGGSSIIQAGVKIRGRFHFHYPDLQISAYASYLEEEYE